jgi:hypothetical protein
MTARTITSFLAALVLASFAAAPTPAKTRLPLVMTVSYNFSLLAAPNEAVYITVLNPAADRNGTSHGNVEFEWKVEEGESSDPEPGLTTIVPGEARSFMLDPRACGTPLDAGSGVRRMIVDFDLRLTHGEGVEATDPAVSVELVDRRTGAARVASIELKRSVVVVEPG